MLRRSIATGLVALAATGAGVATAATTSHPATGPAGLAFYAPKKLPAGPHGTLIYRRSYHGPEALKGAVNTLVMYKQIGIAGKQVAVSGLVSVPRGKAPKGGWPVVSFAHGTTGIAAQCAPTRATGPASGAYSTDVSNAPLLDRWIKDGYAVVRTDYEGLGGPGTHPYLIGRSEGYGVLDIVRAARHLNPGISDRVVISGHSQGGHAALWAASLAPSYTPDLHVLGTLAFAPQSHTAQEVGLLKTVGSSGLSGIAALILRGVDVATPSLHVASLLTPQAAKLYPQTLTMCLDQLDGPSSFGSVPLNQMVSSSADLAPATRVLTRNDPDALKIRGRVLIEQGLADTTVLPPFDQSLSQELAKNGAKVTYHTYPGATHGSVLVVAAKDANAFLRKVFGHR